MKRTNVFIIVLVSLALLTGCGKSAAQTAEISFESNPTTGYRWYAFQSSDLFEITSEYSADSTGENVDGSGGTEHFVLKPLKAGSCEVSFVYQRPDEAIELGDTYSYLISVTNDMQIKVSGGKASILGDMDMIPAVPTLTVK